MQVKRICFHCMEESKNDNGICEACGFNSNEYVVPQHHLPPLTPLNGRYLIGAALGAGGFGITYIALDTHLRVVVTIKELFIKKICERGDSNSVLVAPNNSSLYEENKRRFLEEARVLAMFSKSDGIVAVKEHFEENNTAYIVMEYLDGMTLKKHIQSGKPSYSEAVRLIKPIYQALAKVHQFNVVHKDVSPENIMVLEDGSVKLLDFGGAIITTTEDSGKTISFKRGYAPPEQYVRNGKIGPWTDVYSVAAVLYYCLTGQKPTDAMERKAGKGLLRPSELGAKIPPKAEAAIMKALELEPAMRYQRVEDFWNDYEAQREKTGLNFGKRKSAVIGIILMGITVIGIVLALALSGGKPKADNDPTIESGPGTGAIEEEEEIKPGDNYAIEEGTYLFVNVKNPDYCLGIHSGFGDNFAPLVLKGSENGIEVNNSNRLLVMPHVEGEAYSMQASHTNSYIEVSEDNASVFQNSYLSEGTSSQWEFVYCYHNEETDEDVVYIKNANGLVLTPSDGDIEYGTKVMLAEMDESDPSQQWMVRWNNYDETEAPVIVHVEGDLVEDITGVRNMVSAFGDLGEVLLSVSGDASLEAPEMIAWENVWDETQQFEFVFTGKESRYKIYPIKQKDGEHKCLEYDPEINRIVMRDESDNPNQLFRIVYTGYNMYLIQTYEETVVGFDQDEDGSVNGRAIIARPYDEVEDSRFAKWLLLDVD